MASLCSPLRLWHWLIKLPPHAFQQESPVWTRCWEERDSSAEAACWFPARRELGSPASGRNSRAPLVLVVKPACTLLSKSLPARLSAICGPLASTLRRGDKNAYYIFTPFGQPALASKDTWPVCKNWSRTCSPAWW